MPHIHEKIDLTVCIYIVHDGKVLMAHHKRLDKWLPVGGHVELDEDPETAALRETKEESGLDVELIGTKPTLKSPGTRFLVAPTYLDIHDITEDHQHIGMIYFARATTDTVALAPEEHHAIRWFTPADIDDPTWGLSPAIKFYCHEALKRAAT